MQGPGSTSIPLVCVHQLPPPGNSVASFSKGCLLCVSHLFSVFFLGLPQPSLDIHSQVLPSCFPGLGSFRPSLPSLPRCLAGFQVLLLSPLLSHSLLFSSFFDAIAPTPYHIPLSLLDHSVKVTLEKQQSLPCFFRPRALP